MQHIIKNTNIIFQDPKEELRNIMYCAKSKKNYLKYLLINNSSLIYFHIYFQMIILLYLILKEKILLKMKIILNMVNT